MTRSSHDRPRCDECGGPLGAGALRGRAWPHRLPATYCCYGCLSLGERARQTSSGQSDTSSLGGLGFRLGIALVIAGQSTIFGLALNLHDDVPASVRSLVQWLIFASTLLVLALLGGPLFLTAGSELRRGRITIEALFLLTMGGALAASLQAQLTGHGKIYFEVVSILLVVYTIGKIVGARSRAKVIAASRAWSGLIETCRRIEPHGESRSVIVREVRPGDVVEVYAGESIPVDGTIRDGVGFMSEAPVSGEPFPVLRRPGDRVLAGASSYDATFRIESSTRGADRHIDRILAVVDGARDTPLSLQSQADRLAHWFLPLTVLVALGTFGYWTYFTPRGWEEGLFNAMAVLLVACPCAIGLATPVAVWCALGRLAERGLIVRRADAVERLAEVDCVFLDKTGTLTDEEPRFLRIETRAVGLERDRLLGWLALLERHSHHPLARPFAEFLSDAAPGDRIADVRTVPGCGIEGTILTTADEQHRVRIGRPDWIASRPVEADPGSRQVEASIDGAFAARAHIAERMRSSSAEALEQFQSVGITGEVVTGDSQAATGLHRDFPIRSGLLPGEKQKIVAEARAAGAKPLMVGDGINDAAALASAHVGIALASGTDLAVEAADATLYGGDLRVLPWAVAVSREAVRTVRLNLARALAYNLTGMALAASGLLHPIAAVLLMMASSITLLALSTRARNPNLHCSQARPRRRGTVWRVVVHGSAITLQSVALLLLVEAFRLPLIAAAIVLAFSLAGWAAGRTWLRQPNLPHGADMAFGMLTLGNLGMLLGWWYDSGFAPLPDAGCEACRAAIRGDVVLPGMWIGMLLGANIAMAFLGRQPVPRGPHAAAMFTGGNVGMVIGMAAGGWCAAGIGMSSVPGAVLLAFVGMTVGMILGMLAGTQLSEYGIAMTQRWITHFRSTRFPRHAQTVESQTLCKKS